MNPYQAKVREFMTAMRQHVRDDPTIDQYPFELRVKLILEEAVEFAVASGLGVWTPEYEKSHTSYAIDSADDLALVREGPTNWPEMIDALCDLLYVVFGAANAMGIDLDVFFDEVHRTNLLKAGGTVRPDGKIEKPPGWSPPDIERLLSDVIVER